MHLILSWLLAGLSAQAGTGLSKNTINAVVQRNRPKTRSCYTEALKKNPKAKGKVDLRFTIAAEGAVSSVDVKEDGAGEPSLTECLTSAVKTWRFPATESGEPTEVPQYPFLFQP